jgi:hypothetical protein
VRSEQRCSDGVGRADTSQVSGQAAAGQTSGSDGFGQVSGLDGFGSGEKGFPLQSPPPSRKASTRCLCHAGDGLERDRAKGHDQVLGVELCDFFWGVFDIFRVFPSVSFYTITFLFD